MSFNYNPYKHIEVIDTGDKIVLYCHGCGAEISEWQGNDFGLTTHVLALFLAMAQHVKLSHKRTQADFTGWSIR